MSRIFFGLAIAVLLAVLFLPGFSARAECGVDESCPGVDGESVQAAVDADDQSGTDQLRASASKRLNPFSFNDPNDFLARLVNWVVAIIGTLALVFYVWAGFLYMTAQGNAERIDSAKRIFVWTTFGVVGVLLSSFAVRLLFSQLNPVSLSV